MDIQQRVLFGFMVLQFPIAKSARYEWSNLFVVIFIILRNSRQTLAAINNIVIEHIPTRGDASHLFIRCKRLGGLFGVASS